MKNVDMKVEGDKLVITVDLKQRNGESKSGKNLTVASTGGNVSLEGHPEIKLGLNVFASK